MRAVLLLALLCTALAGGDFLNTKVKRRIDLSSALVRTRVDLTVKSLADESKSVYKLAFPDAEVARTAFFQVKSKGTVLQTSSVGSL